MAEGMRQVVDDIVEVLRPESWSDRFAALYGLLCDKLKERTASDPSRVLQEWSGIVTATLEQLPPDSSVVECLALMSVSLPINGVPRRLPGWIAIPMSSSVLIGPSLLMALRRQIGNIRSTGRRAGAGDRVARDVVGALSVAGVGVAVVLTGAQLPHETSDSSGSPSSRGAAHGLTCVRETDTRH